MLIALCLPFLFSFASCEITSGINVFEYISRFINNWNECRYNVYKDDGTVDFNFYLSAPVITELGDQSMMSTEFGLIVFDNDFSVDSIMLTFYDSSKGQQVELRDSLIQIVAMSVLEYNHVEQNLMKSMYEHGLTDSPDIITASIKLWNEKIRDNITYEVYQSARSGNTVKIYSGKSYDYSIGYYEIPGEGNSVTSMYFMDISRR